MTTLLTFNTGSSVWVGFTLEIDNYRLRVGVVSNVDDVNTLKVLTCKRRPLQNHWPNYTTIGEYNAIVSEAVINAIVGNNIQHLREEDDISRFRIKLLEWGIVLKDLGG